MKVIIVSDFWTNVENNKDLIVRCFRHLLAKYPNPDGEMDAFNGMLNDMFRLRVFAKFSRKRLVANKLGLNKKFAHVTVTEEETTDEAMKAIGIDVRKKFEQFIYKWVEHCLQESYNRRRNHSQRYISNGIMAESPVRSFAEVREYLQESPWAQSDEEVRALAAHVEKSETSKTKTYPTFRDTGSFIGSKHDDPLDNAVERDLAAKLMKTLQPGGKEMQVATLAMEGYCAAEIAEVMDCSSQYVGTLLKRVRERFLTLMQQQEIA